MIYASHCGIPFCGKIPSDWTQGIWADRKGLSEKKVIFFHIWQNTKLHYHIFTQISGKKNAVNCWK